MRFDLVGLGVSTVDLIQVVDRLPRTELVQRAHACAISGGGPVATAVVAASRLGANCAMIDRIGDDLFGRTIMEELERERVDISGVVVVPGRSSSKASILVRQEDGARAITYSPGDAGDLAPEEVNRDLVRSARILHLNGRHWEASLHAAKLAREGGVPVSFDGGAHRFQPEHRELIPLVDICIVAREYASSFSGSEDPAAAAESLLRGGPKLVAITAGMEGSWVFSGSGEGFHQKALEIGGVVDTTGAGDAYHGAFLFGVARDLPLRQVAAYAAAAGALNTRALGGRAALPTLGEIEDLLAQSPSCPPRPPVIPL